MARRKKDDGLVDILVTLPWWVSVAAGTVAYIAFRWIAPAMLPAMLRPIAPALNGIAWLPFTVFCFIGFVAFTRASIYAAKPGGSKPSVVHSPYQPVEPSPTPAASNPEHQWGRQTSATHRTASSVPPAPFLTWTLDGLRAMETLRTPVR
jgi:hypothetical protein